MATDSIEMTPEEKAAVIGRPGTYVAEVRDVNAAELTAAEEKRALIIAAGEEVPADFEDYINSLPRPSAPAEPLTPPSEPDAGVPPTPPGGEAPIVPGTPPEEPPVEEPVAEEPPEVSAHSAKKPPAKRSPR